MTIERYFANAHQTLRPRRDDVSRQSLVPIIGCRIDPRLAALLIFPYRNACRKDLSSLLNGKKGSYEPSKVKCAYLGVIGTVLLYRRVSIGDVRREQIGSEMAKLRPNPIRVQYLPDRCDQRKLQRVGMQDELCSHFGRD